MTRPRHAGGPPWPFGSQGNDFNSPSVESKPAEPAFKCMVFPMEVPPGFLAKKNPAPASSQTPPSPAVIAVFSDGRQIFGPMIGKRVDIRSSGRVLLYGRPRPDPLYRYRRLGQIGLAMATDVG